RQVPAISPQVLHAMPIADVFDYLGTRVNGPRAGTPGPIVINWMFTDTRESLTSTLEHGALTSTTRKIAPNADTTVTTTRPVFDAKGKTRSTTGRMIPSSMRAVILVNWSPFALMKRNEYCAWRRFAFAVIP